MKTRTIAVGQGTLVTHIGNDGAITRSPVEDLVGEQKTYDFYGDTETFTVSVGAKPEGTVAMLASTGELFAMGVSSAVYVRSFGEGQFRLRNVTDIELPTHVRLPQKKIVPLPEYVFNGFDIDKTGLFVSVPDVSHFATTMKELAWRGLVVNRHKTALRIDLEKRRPSCFASKLINGTFQTDLGGAMSILASGSVIVPWRMDWGDVVNEAARTSVIFEGNCNFNDVTLVPPRRIEKVNTFYHITLKAKPSLPVELSWFCV